jgi:uncharacterized protein YgbK (DUF1537 family)
MPEILVIADDFTGAAEIGGIAHLFGLSVSIMKEWADSAEHKEDVIIIDTNTRRLGPEETSGRIIRILEHVDFSTIDLIYKKVDSVLRGPVESEIKALMSLADKNSAVLIPANPSKNRIIKNGKYYIESIPISQTDFINDPGYPRDCDEVKDLIIDATEFLYIGDPPVYKNINKIVIPDVYSLENISDIICKISIKSILPAGGADFFKSLLQQKLNLLVSKNYSYNFTGEKRHFILGSKSEKSNQTISDLVNQGFVCFLLKEDVMQNKYLYSTWEDQIRTALQEGLEVIIARPENPILDQNTISSIPSFIAKASNRLLHYCSRNDEVFIEGGETASTIFRSLDNCNLVIKEVISDGVVKLQLPDSGICLTVKPGSYIWPEIIFNQKE